MIDSTATTELFELELILPDAKLQAIAARLIGFDARYERLHRDLRLLSDPSGVRAWSNKYYHMELPLCASISDRYPLVIFAGDVGTGKTATAECACDKLAREAKREAMLFKLSTRVRGAGKVGEMSNLLNQAFETVAKQAGKTRHAFLIIDEADSLTTSRDGGQSHHEDKVAVNTIIQKIDDLRRHSGRILVFLCTNRAGAMDPAVMRRAARIEAFERPNEQERELLFRMDFEGMQIKDEVIKELVSLTGQRGGRPGFTFSDIRSRLLPEALCRAFPTRALTSEDLLHAAAHVRPSPEIKE